MRISDWSQTCALPIYLREKNVLSRADIEELRNRVEARMATPDSGLSCATALVAAAVNEMRELDDYCGKKYGGKHQRQGNRSEERRVGKEWVRTGRYGWAPCHIKKKKNKIENSE